MDKNEDLISEVDGNSDVEVDVNIDADDSNSDVDSITSIDTDDLDSNIDSEPETTDNEDEIISPSKTGNIKNVSVDSNITTNLQSTPAPDLEDMDEIDYELINRKLINNFDNGIINRSHPESKAVNYNEVNALSKVIRDKDNNIIDDLHKTIPILSRYEKAAVLGTRTKQLNNGNNPYIQINSIILDNYLIAESELKQKKLPFIIKRPIPNGGFEYWHIEDLELL